MSARKTEFKPNCTICGGRFGDPGVKRHQTRDYCNRCKKERWPEKGKPKPRPKDVRKRESPCSPCPDGPDHEVVLRYDVPVDLHFVACMTCGLTGPRHDNPGTAKSMWGQRRGLEMPAVCS